uniref:Uncharacterized protein n=1 Tax=viral metagenome TaxID=1070528 RepID=A0A6M3K0U4_9ZZZZ
MTFFIKEIKEKIKRIEELKNNGFNTPRMFFIKSLPTKHELSNALKWAKKIYEKDEKQIFNIRTYREFRGKESALTPHVTDIPYGKLNENLLKLLLDYNCMIDAETPDNGRIAGTIIINTNEFGRPDKFTIEWCEKPIRAMVRDADRSSTMDFAKRSELDNHLRDIVEQAITFHMKDVVLEWTTFCKPSGIESEPTVWWEWRSSS